MMKPNVLSILRISNAFIQAPMMGVTSPAMVSAISNAGCLGSLPVGGLSVDHTRELIRATKLLTNCAINVNTFTTTEITTCTDTSTSPWSYQNQLAVFIEESVPIVSFACGCMTRAEIKLLQSHRIAVMGTAANVAEALYLKQQGVDVIVAQGYEAGGHKGSFSIGKNAHLNLVQGDAASTCSLQTSHSPPGIGLFSLLPQVCAAVNPARAPVETYTPIVAAGGVYSGRTAVAAYTLGADAVQIGSSFINTAESLASVAHKRAVAMSSDVDTDFVYFSNCSARVLTSSYHRAGLGSICSAMDGTCSSNYDSRLFWAGQSSGKYGSSAAYHCRQVVSNDNVNADVNSNNASDMEFTGAMLTASAAAESEFNNRSCADVLADIIADTNKLLSRQMGLF